MTHQNTDPDMRSMVLTEGERKELLSRAKHGYLGVAKLATGRYGYGLFMMQTRRDIEGAATPDQSGPDLNNLDITAVPDSDDFVLRGDRQTFTFLRAMVMRSILDEGFDNGFGQSGIDIIDGPASGPRTSEQSLYARLYELSTQNDADSTPSSH